MDPISYPHDGHVIVEKKQEVDYVVEQLDINSFVSLPDDATRDHEADYISTSQSGAEGISSLNTSFEDEQVAAGGEGEDISEIVVVPVAATSVVIHTEVVSDVLTSSYSYQKASSPSGDTRTKWKEVESEFSPPIDIVELQDSYHVYAEVPGMNVKDISIDLSNNLFTLTGDKCEHPLLSRTKDDSVVVQEINKGRFKRVLELPDNVDTNDVDVLYEGGILQFKIRKIEKEEQPEEEEEVETEGNVQEDVVNTNEEETNKVISEKQTGEVKKHRKTKGGKKRSSCAIQ